MKKLLITAIAVGLMSISAMAADGKVTSVKITSWDGVTVEITRADSTVASALINLTGDNLKTFVAIALSAKATGDDVWANWAPGGWNAIKIK